jgi:hypothetical protein
VATEHSNSGHSCGIRGHGRGAHAANGLNSGHRTLQQWPPLRHPWPWPALALGQWTQLWPQSQSTVATVPTPSAKAGARKQPEHLTVATTDANRGHSYFPTIAPGSVRIQLRHAPVASLGLSVTIKRIRVPAHHRTSHHGPVPS